MYDVVVVGAGVVGLFTAYLLARKGYSVALVEAEREPGLGVTSRQANVIHVVQTPLRSLRARLCLEGNRAYRGWVRRELGVRLEETVAILAATTVKGVAKLLAAYAYLRLALPRRHRPRIVGWKEAVELEPSLSDAVKAALIVPGYAVADWRDVVAKLKHALDELGVDQYYGSRVSTASVAQDHVVLEAGGARLRARFVVNAAGLYADEIAELMGDRGPRIVPRKGVILVYGFRATRTIVASVEAPRSRRTKGGAIVPQLNGTTFVGPNLAGETVKTDTSYSSRDVEELVERFQPLIAARLGKPSSVIVGLRPSAPDNEFHVVVGGRGRAIHLIGIESPGFTAAPALAERVAALLTRRLGERGERVV